MRLRAQVAEDLPEKKPRASVDPNAIFGMRMRWKCDDPDIDDNWSWGVQRQWPEDAWNERIKPKLEHFAQLTWGEIDQFSSDSGHKMHHNMEVEIICDEAQYRLIEIEKYSDIIFRFRLGNLERLWGFRVLDEFSVLWYDPTHRIYPVG